MNNRNYQMELEKTLEHVCQLGEKPTLLLHSCCAPCSSYVLEYLMKYFCITILYYNPNIYPKREYERRRDELKRFVGILYDDVQIVEMNYQEEEYYQVVKGLEHLGEKSERCFCCYELRMRKAAEYAKANHFDYFTTTLSISPHKNSDKINEIGARLEQELGVSYLYADFKKKNGYKRSLELSREYDLYRQDYCGCVYSKVGREKYGNKNSSSR